jgi:subtilisin family serine protease
MKLSRKSPAQASAKAILTLLLCFVADHGFSDKVKGFFHSQGLKHRLTFDSDLVAVSVPPKIVDNQVVDFRVLPKRLSSGFKIIGVPISFGKDSTTEAILTDQVVVKVARDKTFDFKKMTGFRHARRASFGSNLFLINFDEPNRALQAANQLVLEPDIVYSHPDFHLAPQTREAKPIKSSPTDTFFANQWHLANTGQGGGKPGADISAKNAWEISRGDKTIIVGIIDLGFIESHPEFATLWKSNPLEIPRNGTDDDENGLIDDVTGWNFYKNSAILDNAISNRHGTAVAGVLGAAHDNGGVAGVCPNCSVIPVVIGSSQASEQARAFYYLADRGARIISNSWGYKLKTPNTDVVVEAINAVTDVFDVLVVFAMNNLDKDDCIGDTPDISSLESVIAVSMATFKDEKEELSAWGDCMELLAPSAKQGASMRVTTTDDLGAKGYNRRMDGEDLPDLDYTSRFGGTSAATPMVAGVLGLMLSANPHLSRNEAMGILLNSTDKISPTKANYDPQTGFSKMYGYGRLNGEKAVRAAKVFQKYTRKSAPKSSPKRKL